MYWSRRRRSPSPDIERRLETDESLWHSKKIRRIVLDVAAPAVHYFQRRNLIANQVIGNVANNGSLRLVACVGHPNEILPIVRYWLPQLRIVEAVQLQTDLEMEISRYVLQSQTRQAGAPKTTQPVVARNYPRWFTTAGAGDVNLVSLYFCLWRGS